MLLALLTHLVSSSLALRLPPPLPAPPALPPPKSFHKQVAGDKPMKMPSMAVLGVLKPSPTSLYHLLPPFPTLRFAERTFWAVKMWGCFWKARSDWTVSSVAMTGSVVDRKRSVGEDLSFGHVVDRGLVWIFAKPNCSAGVVRVCVCGRWTVLSFA